MGSSKTGSIVFIEPEATHTQTQELQNLIFDEGEEIKKILSLLTEFLRPYLSYFEMQQSFLLQMDVIYAKARYAKEINGILPSISMEKRCLDYKKAFHPLLLQTNRLEGKVTYPQDLYLLLFSHPNLNQYLLSDPYYLFDQYYLLF